MFFLTLKVGVESSHAVENLCKALYISNRLFGVGKTNEITILCLIFNLTSPTAASFVAGTKDKQAITVQRMSVKKVRPETLVKVLLFYKNFHFFLKNYFFTPV